MVGGIREEEMMTLMTTSEKSAGEHEHLSLEEDNEPKEEERKNAIEGDGIISSFPFPFLLFILFTRKRERATPQIIIRRCTLE